jgi:pimeloyl-ACP methyl ester carboxylesterase
VEVIALKIANSRPALMATVAVTRFLGRYSSRLAGVPASVLWFVPWRVPVSERGLRKQARWLEPTEPFELRTTVGRVAGFAAGDGPVVMLMHGLGERAAVLGGFIEPLVDAGYKVVGVDLPGHGDSGGQTTNPIKMAAAARAVADHFGRPHALIAHSLGGAGALWAMNAGLEPDRAVLIAPVVDMTYAMDFFKTAFGLPPKAIDGLQRKIERRFGSNIWNELAGDRLAANMDTPGLVFHDPDDPQVPYEGSERLVRAWKNSTVIDAPGLGHGPITRDLSVIDGAVAFVTESPQGSAASESLVRPRKAQLTANASD